MRSRAESIEAMGVRRKVDEATQADVLIESRRRCCVCFGLNRDTNVKKGQIAHLDGDRNNNIKDNLAFLCFDHHDEYDSRTSQAKNLTIHEVKRYRKELHAHFADQMARQDRDCLLSFLASAVDVDMLAETAVKVAGSVVFYGEEHAFDVLITDAIDYCDEDLYTAHLIALDHFALWGWLTFTEEERKDENGELRTYITAQRKPICDKVALRIKSRMIERGADMQPINNLQGLRAWNEPLGH